MTTTENRIPDLDWSDMGAADGTARAFLKTLASDRRALGRLIDAAENSPRLRGLSEHSPGRKELALLESADKRLQLRLVLDAGTMTDIVRRRARHQATICLRGEYRNIFYSVDQDQAEFMADEGPGVVFTLHGSAFQNIKAQRGIVALSLVEVTESDYSSMRPPLSVEAVLTIRKQLEGEGLI